MGVGVFVVNRILSILTLSGDIIITLFILLFLIKKIPYPSLIKKYSFHFALIVATIATFGSLFYSEIAKYTPCLLCWYQRIFMYPQPVLISMAIIKKDKRLSDYLIALSSLGLLIALYHYYLQLGGRTLLPCTAIGYSASCSSRFFMEFGYITIPLMAATAFLLIIILMFISKTRKI